MTSDAPAPATFGPRVTVVTLGVADVARTRAFYRDGLGWPVRFDADDVLMLDVAPGLVLSFWQHDSMAHEVGEIGDPRTASVVLAHNVASDAAVDDVVAHAVAAGASLVERGTRRVWGGYSGYVSDPDGYRWEIAHNPDWPELAT